MMTVVTTSRLRPGGEAEWDAAMRARFDSARERPGSWSPRSSSGPPGGRRTARGRRRGRVGEASGAGGDVAVGTASSGALAGSRR